MTRKIQWHIMVKSNSYKQNRKKSTVKTNILQKKRNVNNNKVTAYTREYTHMHMNLYKAYRTKKKPQQIEL